MHLLIYQKDWGKCTAALAQKWPWPRLQTVKWVQFLLCYWTLTIALYLTTKRHYIQTVWWVEHRALHQFHQDRTPTFRKTWTIPFCLIRVQIMMEKLQWPISTCKPSSSLRVLSNYSLKVVATTSSLSIMIRSSTLNSSPQTQTFLLSRAAREYRTSLS